MPGAAASIASRPACSAIAQARARQLDLLVGLDRAQQAQGVRAVDELGVGQELAQPGQLGLVHGVLLDAEAAARQAVGLQPLDQRIRRLGREAAGLEQLEHRAGLA